MVSLVKLPATALPRPQPNTPSYQTAPSETAAVVMEMSFASHTTCDTPELMEMPMKHVGRHVVVLDVDCMSCNRTDKVAVLTEDYQRYTWGGDLVQNIWPELDTWEREVIIGYRTGVFQCKKCCDAQEEEE